MASVTDSNRFLELLRQSGVVETVVLDRRLDEFRQAGRAPADAETLATLLVDSGTLTRFQARHLLQGQWRGMLLDGKYKLLDHLGAGGGGSVYLGEHLLMRRKVAVKVLAGDWLADDSAVHRFISEARAAGALDHPNIVRAYDIDQSDGVLYLVMEYVAGESLAQLVARTGPLSPAYAAGLIAQAAWGLQHAHAVGLVHRDIKPANLLLDRAGTLKVADFGLARLSEKHGANSDAVGGGEIVGTIDYLAPEQALGEPKVDGRADIYSLGATFYFLLTGRPPYAGAESRQKLLLHAAGRPAPVRMLRPDIPERMAATLERMMERDPAQRFSAACEVAASLAPCVTPSAMELPASSQPEPTPVTHAVRACRRPQPSPWPMIVFLLVALGIPMMLYAIAYTWVLRQP